MENERNGIYSEIAECLAILSTSGRMLKGSISKVSLGKRKRDEGDRESFLLTFKGNGNKTQTLYVSKKRLADVESMIANYQDAKRVLERIVELNVQLFKIKRVGRGSSTQER